MFPTFSKIWLINVVLTVLIVFFGMMGYDVWSKGDEAIPEWPAAKSPRTPLTERGIAERTVPPDSTFAVVVDKNLFSSTRAEFIPDKQKEGPFKISEKMIFLYGVIFAGDRKQALINNPEYGLVAGQNRPKDKWIKVGDALGNFSVADIRKDRIIVTDGANTHEILLYDKNKPARQATVAEPSAAPTVVAAGPAASATPAAAATMPKPGTEATTPRAAEAKGATAGEYRIVNTPFGPTRRRIE